MNFLMSLASNYPIPAWLAQVAFVIIAIWVIVGIIIFIYKFVSKTNSTNCSFNSLEEKLDSLGNKQSTLVEKFNTLIATLSEKNAIENPDLFSLDSPINLTPKGKNLVREIGWIDSLNNENNRSILFDVLDKLKLKTKYDVEKYSMVLLTELAGTRHDNPYTLVKKYLYEHSQIDDSKALTACAIYLRDEYLKARPEIKE